ncbi:fructokinase [Sphaerisporangium rufum]|uniref:Fructokinase n=1 Tax=Sphaerisporangium rufum TaxID=1381558 RepID=A0A919R2U5_9ACTN|nr:carbohydrate kinase [Sphaerisporangium rufum]GII77350.1 fructokinase [Sphaerisporangium rufum]
MSASPIAVLGECVADAVVTSATDDPPELALRVLPGGGPANTATALARLGTPVRFLGRLSGDRFGALARTRLAASGVDLSAAVAAAEPSTLAVATLDARGGASYTFHAEGTADFGWTREELDPARLGGAVCLHTGSLALVREPGGPRIEDFLARVRERVTVCLDPNVRPSLVDPARYRERIARWCGLADIVKVSEEDLEILAPGLPVGQVFARWHGYGAALVVLTRGGRGATVSLRGRHFSVPAPRVAVADTIGAGDAFSAGLLHRLGAGGALGGRLPALEPGVISEALAFAARVAALTCAVPGADPPWAGEPRLAGG